MEARLLFAILFDPGFFTSLSFLTVLVLLKLDAAILNSESASSFQSVLAILNGIVFFKFDMYFAGAAAEVEAAVDGQVVDSPPLLLCGCGDGVINVLSVFAAFATA